MLEPTPNVAVRLRLTDSPDALARVVAAVAAVGGTLRTLSTPRTADGVAETELEVAGLDAPRLASALEPVSDVLEQEETRALQRASSGSG